MSDGVKAPQRPAQNAYTNGRPVMRVHASPRSTVVIPAASRNNDVSPIISAASHRDSVSFRSGPRASIAGAILNTRAHRTRSSATELRELVSIAIDRTSSIGLVLYKVTEATAPSDAMAT